MTTPAEQALYLINMAIQHLDRGISEKHVIHCEGPTVTEMPATHCISGCHWPEAIFEIDAAMALLTEAKSRLSELLPAPTEDRLILHVSDWNYQDRWFNVPPSFLVEFKERVLKHPDDAEEAWEWLTTQADYGKNPELPAKRRSQSWCDNAVNHTLTEVFFDYNNPGESVNEWDPSEW